MLISSAISIRKKERNGRRYEHACVLPEIELLNDYF